jgi:hypothetical protein
MNEISGRSAPAACLAAGNYYLDSRSIYPVVGWSLLVARAGLVVAAFGMGIPHN